ncbi:hypothetical protein LMH87_011613 [Akanthomyces muscarius]|uniref:Small ubiquitin-related modifier, SUMO n=2 Tax=Akanthomyces TaxID=150366 RepID=A0A162KTD4_CORDF|nr:hypothetical protein LMH87_011613 [Akanthomyces muscarius]KAJ4150884.1 hypothetical protein LMH87_011613 [Akanthomyces muscarius]OAA79558.1 Small ubiquitin-related modifier, SUMO [Akanthomyces lecanii RCEF 1005]
MSDDNGGLPGDAPPGGGTEHLNIKVTDNNNEVFFKIKRTTKLEKLMSAFCDRQGKSMTAVRFLFDGTRVQPTDTPDNLEMADGDTLEVHQEQVGGAAL